MLIKSLFWTHKVLSTFHKNYTEPQMDQFNNVCSTSMDLDIYYYLNVCKETWQLHGCDLNNCLGS